MKKQSLSYVFSKLKDGDTIFFYHVQWWAIFSKLIYLFTGSKLDHVGVCYNVVKDSDSCTFSLTEMTVKHGVISRAFSIIKYNGGYILRGFTATRLVYGELLFGIAPEQKINFLKYIEKNKGSNYDFKELPLTVKWIRRLLPIEFRSSKRTNGVCSTYAYNLLAESGVFKSKTGLYVSPFELSKQPEISCSEIYDYKNF